MNIQGLITKSNNKLQSFEFLDILCKSDLIFLTETWSCALTDIAVNGFHDVRLDRLVKHKSAKRNSGGIAVYIKDWLFKDTTVLKCESDDILWLKINGQVFNMVNDLYLCLCYILPQGSSRQPLIEIPVLDRISDFILEIANETNNNYNLMICGDFNSRTSTNLDFVLYDNDANIHALPSDYTIDENLPRFSQDYITNQNGRNLLEFCILNNLRICNGRVGADKGIGKYTFVGKAGCSVVDYVLVSSDLLQHILYFEVCLPNILSDHCTIVYSIKHFACNDYTDQPLHSQNENISKKYVWNINEKENYLNALHAENETVLNLTTDIAGCSTPGEIDQNIFKFLHLIYQICDPLFSKAICKSQKYNHLSKKKQPQWFDEECKLSRNYFYRQLNIYREIDTNENRFRMVQARTRFKHVIRQKKISNEILKTEKLVHYRSDNPKEYWRLLKETTDNRSVNSITSEEFENYFRGLSDPDDPFYIADDDIKHNNEQYVNGMFQILFEELNIPIQMEEYNKALKQLRNNKSPGPDLLLNEFFKHGTDELNVYILNLFNTVFESGYFPESWAEGFIIPIHKKGDRNDVSNYRGITLLSALGKLFTRILNNRLTAWAEKYGIYIEAQAGFRKNMSTIDNIFVLRSLIRHYLNKNENLFCAFVDFTKAFDYVVRDVIWYKLIKIGVRGKMLDIIKSIYKNVKSQVKHNNTLSSSFICNIGVRQGECLSPFLFSMCLNDLEDELMNSGVQGIVTDLIHLFVLLYADDIILMATSAEDLQKALNTLANYCLRWKLTVNVNKTKIIIFRVGGRLPLNIRFTYNGIEIEIVSEYSYLGILFTAGGSCLKTQKTLAGQALKAIFTLNKYLIKFSSLKVSHVLDLFDRLIAPILNYSSEVWGFQKSKDIDVVHLHFCKKLLGIKRTTQNDFIYGELGTTDFQSRRFTNIIKYWLKILTSSENKIIKKAYNTMLNDLILYPNKDNWASMVRTLLSKLGFYEVWLAQSVGNITKFLTIFKTRVRDTFIQDWHSRLQDSSRARFYVTFANFKYQNYLDCLSLIKFRRVLTRYRVSSHKLEVEAGRWTKPNKTPLENRKCKLCNVLEDEYHFVLECDLYKELRKKYIKRYYWQRPNMMKLIELVTSENNNTIKRLSVYLEKAFKLRYDCLYS